MQITTEQAKKLLDDGGTEMALRLLTQEGFIRYMENKSVRARDISKRPRLE